MKKYTLSLIFVLFSLCAAGQIKTSFMYMKDDSTFTIIGDTSEVYKSIFRQQKNACRQNEAMCELLSFIQVDINRFKNYTAYRMAFINYWKVTGQQYLIDYYTKLAHGYKPGNY